MALSYKYSKGTGPVSADYAKGGAELTTRSRFLKTPDTFRTSIEEQNYGKKSPGGELSKTEGETKKLPVVKPRT